MYTMMNFPPSLKKWYIYRWNIVSKLFLVQNNLCFNIGKSLGISKTRTKVFVEQRKSQSIGGKNTIYECIYVNKLNV